MNSPALPSYRTFDWSSFLEECSRRTYAEACFLVDEGGLLIALLGDLSVERAQALGVSLMMVLAEVHRMRHGLNPSRSVAVEAGNSWLCGFRVQANTTRTYTVGLVVADPILRRTRLELTRWLAGELGGE